MKPSGWERERQREKWEVELIFYSLAFNVRLYSTVRLHRSRALACLSNAWKMPPKLEQAANHTKIYRHSSTHSLIHSFTICQCHCVVATQSCACMRNSYPFATMNRIQFYSNSRCIHETEINEKRKNSIEITTIKTHIKATSIRTYSGKRQRNSICTRESIQLAHFWRHIHTNNNLAMDDFAVSFHSIQIAWMVGSPFNLVFFITIVVVVVMCMRVVFN